MKFAWQFAIQGLIAYEPVALNKNSVYTYFTTRME